MFQVKIWEIASTVLLGVTILDLLGVVQVVEAGRILGTIKIEMTTALVVMMMPLVEVPGVFGRAKLGAEGACITH